MTRGRYSDDEGISSRSSIDESARHSRRSSVLEDVDEEEGDKHDDDGEPRPTDSFSSVDLGETPDVLTGIPSRPPSKSVSSRPPAKSVSSRPPAKSVSGRPPSTSISGRPPSNSVVTRPASRSVRFLSNARPSPSPSMAEEGRPPALSRPPAVSVSLLPKPSIFDRLTGRASVQIDPVETPAAAPTPALPKVHGRVRVPSMFKSTPRGVPEPAPPRQLFNWEVTPGHYFWSGGGASGRLNVNWGSKGSTAPTAPVIVPENTVGRDRGMTREDGEGLMVQLRNVGGYVSSAATAVAAFARTRSISSAHVDDARTGRSHAESLVADQHAQLQAQTSNWVDAKVDGLTSALAEEDGAPRIDGAPHAEGQRESHRGGARRESILRTSVI